MFPPGNCRSLGRLGPEPEHEAAPPLRAGPVAARFDLCLDLSASKERASHHGDTHRTADPVDR